MPSGMGPVAWVGEEWGSHGEKPTRHLQSWDEVCGALRALPPPPAPHDHPDWGQGRANYSHCPEGDVEAIEELFPPSGRVLGRAQLRE